MLITKATKAATQFSGLSSISWWYDVNTEWIEISLKHSFTSRNHTTSSLVDIPNRIGSGGITGMSDDNFVIGETRDNVMGHRVGSVNFRTSYLTSVFGSEHSNCVIPSIGNVRDIEVFAVKKDLSAMWRR